MVDNGIIIQWGGIVPGRETMSTNVFMQALRYAEELKNNGKIMDYHVYLASQGNFSFLSGTMILDGSEEQIRHVFADERYNEIVLKSQQVASNFFQCHAVTGPNMMKRMEQLANVRRELGIE
jgi:hypothetical protein